MPGLSSKGVLSGGLPWTNGCQVFSGFRQVISRTNECGIEDRNNETHRLAPAKLPALVLAIAIVTSAT